MAVKRRPYDSSVRRAQAAATRARIVEAADELFTANGYAATTIREISERAGVAVDTVYATFGSKPRVLTAILDARLVQDAPAPNVMDRPAAQAVRHEKSQRRQIELFARDMAAINARVRTMFRMLEAAAAADPEVAPVYREMQEQRLRNQRRAVEWIAANGPLRVEVDRAVDIVWTLTSPDVGWMLCDARGWTQEEHAEWLADMLKRALLPSRRSARPL